MIKVIQSWFARNFFNLFGILGILLTIYVGVFHIPYQLRAAKIEKHNRAQLEVEQSLKELSFSDSSINFLEVKFLIDAKEIELAEKFPLSMAQVLTLTQQSFMNDKFLPLEHRRELIQKLEGLKTSLPKNIETASTEVGFNSVGAFFSIVLSLAIAFLGAFSLFKRQKREEALREELSNEIEQTEIAFTAEKPSAAEVENKLIAVLKRREGLQIISDVLPAGNGLLLHFSYQKKYYAAVFKFVAYNKIGLSTIKPVFYFLDNNEAEIWIVYNTGLTALARHEIKKYNRLHPGVVVRTVKANTISEFEKGLEQLLPAT